MGVQRGPDHLFGRLLQWLTDGRLRFAAIGSPYDIVRLPGIEFPIEVPLQHYVERLKAAFPDEAAAIDAYFTACNEARRAATALLTAQASPAPFATVLGWFQARRARHALEMASAGNLKTRR